MRSILYIGNKLNRHGFTPGVIETLGPLLEQAGYKMQYAGTCKIRLHRLFEILSKTFIIGRKVDYILIDTYSTSAFWYAFLTGLIAKIIGIKYVTILRGGDLPSRLRRSRRACHHLFRKSYANVAISGYLSHEFGEAGYKTIIVPNVINLSNYPFMLREHPRPKLLWVRSFHRQYNPNMAADVLKELLNTHLDAELCMVGPDMDGSMEEFRNYTSTLGLSDHVKVTGLVNKEELIKLSEKYDFFINTTNVDNTPISVIEALGLGLTVISTNPGGIPFLLTSGQNSILVDCGDYKNMAEQISGLINNPPRNRQISLKGRELAESFDWAVLEKLWTALLK